ncbi:DUF397 domain-containing protein [Sphaerisporangium sp. NPDC004334]
MSLAPEGAALQNEEGGELRLVRDSKYTAGPVIAFRPVVWRAFIGGIKNGWADRTG